MSRRADLRLLPLDLVRGEGTSIFEALYNALRDAMVGGRLRAGARLPSSRDLGLQLGVARGTVVGVYEQLKTEGYLTARKNSGTQVAENLPDRWFNVAARDAASAAPSRRSARLSRRGKELASPFPAAPRTTPRPLRAHISAVDSFPSAIWGALVAKRAQRDERLLLSDGDVRGYRPLREILAEHLRVARGVFAAADRIVILPSVQQALDIATRLATEPGDAIWCEDPSYRGAQAVLGAAGLRVVAAPVDEHGLDVDEARRRAPNARMVYVTPGHQAPLGVTMTADRRAALLRWAQSQRALVVEDDYDSEYLYEGRPIPALQGLDRTGVVLHVGTFSKTLLPSLRLAYAVVPDGLLDPFLTAKSILDRYTPSLQQAALADFIEGGHFGRHLRRMRALYAERRAALLSAIESDLGGVLAVGGASAGLEAAARFAGNIDDRAAERALATVGIETLALSRHALSRRDLSGLVLGFAAFSPARIRKSVATMAKTLTALVENAETAEF